MYPTRAEVGRSAGAKGLFDLAPGQRERLRSRSNGDNVGTQARNRPIAPPHAKLEGEFQPMYSHPSQASSGDFSRAFAYQRRKLMPRVLAPVPLSLTGSRRQDEYSCMSDSLALHADAHLLRQTQLQEDARRLLAVEGRKSGLVLRARFKTYHEGLASRSRHSRR